MTGEHFLTHALEFHSTSVDFHLFAICYTRQLMNQVFCQTVLKFSSELNVNSSQLTCSQWQWCLVDLMFTVFTMSLADGTVQLRPMGRSIQILEQPLVVDLSIWSDLKADITTEPCCSPDEESETFLHGLQNEYSWFVDMEEVQNDLYCLFNTLLIYHQRSFVNMFLNSLT